MTSAELTESVRAELRRDFALGRIRAEIEMAKEEAAATPLVWVGCVCVSTQRMLANTRVARLMAREIQILRGEG